ncbi:HIT family protein [Herbidospora cretacea]|uniref:HIT family protein n=1 Tax=Herbidospora cretacea TaxID=28444 RepID=UPI0009EE1863|nr:hypothetical protein [Herbidospora cretacea]
MTDAAPSCAYCRQSTTPDEPPGGWVYWDEHWLVHHGPVESSRAGTMKILSRRHYTDFADMTEREAASFGVLLRALDTAMRACTDAERVHVVSTRDRVPHFHAWLYRRPATRPSTARRSMPAGRPRRCAGTCRTGPSRRSIDPMDQVAEASRLSHLIRSSSRRRSS